MISRRVSLGMFLLGLILATAPRATADAPATKPTAPPPPPTQPATQPPKRELAAVRADLLAAGEQWDNLVPETEMLLDEGRRREIAPKATPILKKLQSLLDEMLQINPMQKPRIELQQRQMRAMLALLGDADAESAIQQRTKSADPVEALDAKATLLQLRWWRSSKDPAAQAKILDEALPLAAANPDDDNLAIRVARMAQRGAATGELRDRALKILTDTLKGKAARQIAEVVIAMQKLQGLLNKPWALKGKTLAGQDFDLSTLKGKVVLVEFWASWCGISRTLMPDVKKAYADFHAKGLEIVGVSCDRNADDLKTYLAENKEIVWPQLIGGNDPETGMPPIAAEIGVRGTPTMLLIDRKGTVRSIDLREILQGLIPRLLDEKAP